MATVVGIFENYFIKKKPLPVVRPGSQKRRFTHIKDTINACLVAWKKNRNAHYAVVSAQSHSIVQLAKMFNCKFKYITKRLGERHSSALPTMNLNNKIIRMPTKIKLKEYINDFLEKSKN
jgi:UDP-glucose 4-epimerase